MSVVLRCAICGTQGHTGECEACSEGEVQYFCTNHNQGIWLDGPVCSRCEAKFGDPPRRPAPAPTPPPVLAGRAEAPRLPPPGSLPHAGAAAPPRFRAAANAAPGPGRPGGPAMVPRAPSLGELLEEITEARARSRAPSEVDETPGPDRPGAVSDSRSPDV